MTDILGVRQVRKTKVYHEIVDQIRELIAAGRIKPGDRLPPERELAELFKASRNSVRDAIRVLEQMGLIESRQGDGTYVRTVSAEDLAEPLALMLLQSRTQMRELWEVRRVLEPALAEFAASRITDEELDELDVILQAQGRKVEAGATALEEDIAFHYGIAEAARNTVMLRTLDTLVDLLRQSRERSLQQHDRPAYSLAGHKRILAALRRRDPERARAEMLRHLTEVEERVFSAGDA
ncbi:MAG TPA: FadR/GntR family transcriptional regulator [Candidatus Dormibacteraeota bacterium]|nr:FadR/GntR family transcriptional regulator [Candidatus Dormibacteraeota bacterium]